MAASLDSSRGQAFVAGTLAGAAAAALGTYYLCSKSHSSLTGVQQPQQQLRGQAAEPAHHASLQHFDQDEVLAEQLTRNTQFFGLEKQKQITNAFVVVIGLGVSNHDGHAGLVQQSVQGMAAALTSCPAAALT